MNLKIPIVVITIAASLFFFQLPQTAQAASVEELLALIVQLKAQIAELQQQLQQIQGQPVAWCHDFPIAIRFGDSGREVLALQTALQKEGFSVGSEVDGSSFGEQTASAVVGFQQKYRDEILTPLGFKFGTGFVGRGTRAKLNALYACVSGQPSTPKPQNVDIQSPPPLPFPPPPSSPTAPTITVLVLSPNGGEQLKSGGLYSITWSTNAGAVNIELWKGNTFIQHLAIGVEGGKGLFPWAIPLNLSLGTDYKIYVSVLNAQRTSVQFFDSSDTLFSIIPSSTPPSPPSPPIDNTLPAAFFGINGGATATSSSNVTLSLSCADASGIKDVRYSNDGVFDTEPFEPFTAQKSWTLTSGDGMKIVFYQCRDNSTNQNTSVVARSITLDTTVTTTPPPQPLSTPEVVIPTFTTLNPHIYILEDDWTFGKEEDTYLAKRFYSKYPDLYDFISFHVKNADVSDAGFGTVKQDAKGTFTLTYTDRTSSFGSKGKLLGQILVTFDFDKTYVKRDPFQNPIGVLAGFYFSILSHELTHYWGVFLPKELEVAYRSLKTGGYVASHWEEFTGSWVSASGTPNKKVIESPDGKYYFQVNCTTEPKQHDFDLYSMGLKSPDEIKEKLVVVTDPDLIEAQSLCGTREIPKNLIEKVLTIQDMIKVLGPRVPSVADSKKDFTIAFVMVVPKGETLSQKQIDALNWVAEKFPIIWYKSTEGRSTLNGIKPKDTAPPLISNVTTSATGSSLTVTWTTNEPATSFVIYTRPLYTHPYGPSLISPVVTTNPPKYSTSHNIIIESSDWTPVTPHTEYSVQVISIDQDYNLASFDVGKVYTQ